jgi:hypothetical protein
VLGKVLAVVFMLASMYFAWRSFYRMRIGGSEDVAANQPVVTGAHSS